MLETSFVSASAPLPHLTSVRSMTGAVTRRLRAETAGWESVFRADSLEAIARTVAETCPWLGVDQLVTLGKVGVWICGFDDLVDAHDVPVHELELRVQQYVACASGILPPEVGFDPLALLLVDLTDHLRRMCREPPLWRTWLEQFEKMLDAMVWGRAVGGARAVERGIDLESYLDRARHSIGMGCAVTAGWILLGEATTDRLPRLLEALAHASLAVRLANDVQTWAREQQEGSINALAIVGDGAQPMLLSRCREEMATLHQLAGADAAAGSRAAAMLIRFAQFFVDLYAEGDLPELARRCA